MARLEQAVILAAGEGQRLRPFTLLKPKVMIRLASRPILQYVVEALAANGVRSLVMVVGYRKEQVQDFFGCGEHFGVNIQYVFQKQQLGTAHALKQARDAVGERFLVLSGDAVIDQTTIADLAKAELNVILVKKQENVSKYGVVMLEGEKVREVVEKPLVALSNLVNTGIYLFDRRIFEFVAEEVDLPNALQRLLERGLPLRAMETEGTWLDAVYPWDVLQLNHQALGYITPRVDGVVETGVVLKGRVSIGRGTVLRAHTYIEGPAIIGEDCEIGPSVCIKPSTSIGHNVTVHPFTEIKNCVIGDDVQIGTGSLIYDSIIDRHSRLQGLFAAPGGEAEVRVNGEHHTVRCGAMIGEYCQVGAGVVVEPGVIISNHCRIKARKVLRENLPEGSLVV